MTADDERQLKAIFRRSIRNQHVTADEMRYCDKMLKEHPTRYRDLHDNETDAARRELNPFYRRKPNRA